MTDLIGITSAIDHIVYMILNAIATILWRLDAAIISMSLYSYGTQDWLTGTGGNGGVWGVLEWLIGPGGLAGVTTWTLFGSLALMLWGLAKIAKPFISFQPVDIGKLVIFFVLSYVVISQGTSLMPAIEAWRVGAGSFVYEAISSSDAAVIDVPAAPTTSDPLGSPADLDGTGVIRAWEAVATTYFLVTTPEELHRSYPPDEFMQAYCLYNPEQPINNQAVTNAAGCSPRLAWDEWDAMSIDVLQDSYGIDLDPILGPVQEFFGWFGITFDFSSLITMMPVVRHHPENRELGIRQAQSGIARLAMGIIVSIFPMVEANIALMLALAASFIYITLPIALLFGFFLSTESIVNRLFMQFAAVVMRTIIVQGMVALFMLILMNTAATGSLTAYIGLVGVGLIGGWVLMGVATSTMKETFSQSMGAVSSIWMGSTTGLLGQGAAAPAGAALGAAKLAGGTALLAGGAWTGGAGRAWELYDTTSQSSHSGMGDLRAGAPAAAAFIEKQRGRLPDALHRLTSQLGLTAGPQAEAGMHGAAAFSDPSNLPLSSQPGLAAGIGMPDQQQPGRQPFYSPQDPLAMARWGAATLPAATSSLAAAEMMTTATHTPEARQRRGAAVDRWIDQSYKARETQTGQRRASEAGRDLLGEELTWKAERAMERHTPAEVSAVMTAARAAAEEGNRADLVHSGRLTRKAVEAVKQQLDPETAKAFQGEKGAWDMAALTAVALQEQKQAEPDQFRQAMARSKSGWGEDSPAHKVPKELGLDPVAAGSHYTALNRFARLADDASLSKKQREQLMKEAQSGKVSDATRQELEKAIAEQQKQGRAQGLTADALIAGAAAVPATIAGPEQIWTTPAKPTHIQRKDTDDTANLGIELKRGQREKKQQEAKTTAPVSVGKGAAAVAVAGTATGGIARTTAVLGEMTAAPAMIGATRPDTGEGQAGGGRASHVVEPMVAAPTMASSRGRGTGDTPSAADSGPGARSFGQELRGQVHIGGGVVPATQQPGSTAGVPATDGAPNMGAPSGVGGPTFYTGAELGQSSGFGQELRTAVPDPAPSGGAPFADGPPVDSAQGLVQPLIGNVAPGWTEPVAAEPFVDMVTNMEAPAGVGGQVFYSGGGFNQELRPVFPDQEPAPPPVSSPPPMASQPADSAFGAARTPISNIGPNWTEQPAPAAAPATDVAPNMGAPSGVGGQTTVYSGSGLGQSSGFTQELRTAVQDPAPMSPLVSGPPPVANTPTEGMSESARPPINETFRPPEPVTTPQVSSAPGAGASPMMQYNAGQPVTSKSAAPANPSYSNGSFGQELSQAASAPAPSAGPIPPVSTPPPSQPAPPPQPPRQPIGAATGGPPVIESIAPPRMNPAPAAGAPPVMQHNPGRPAVPATPPPTQSRRGIGGAVPIKPPPARTRGAMPPAQTQSPAEPEKGFSRGGSNKKANKDKKG